MDLQIRREMEGGGLFEGEDAGGRRYFLDRSKLRVLLCEKDTKSSQDVQQLLYNCSYKVTTVRTAKQVIDMLTTCGAEIDIVLAEVDLPVAKGLKMLKCIARKKQLRRIPIIMMSSQDEVSIIVKCLRLGAVDYLVKPLRSNELLNLWTHAWRRRRMLGLAEKDNFNQEIELILSDPSDANTNSTTILSEDTDDKARTTHQEITFLDQEKDQFDTSAAIPHQNILIEKEANALHDANHAVFSGQRLSRLRKTNLKAGESSAFFTYVRTSAQTSNSRFSHVGKDSSQFELLNCEENHFVGDKTESSTSRDVQESYSQGNSFPNSENACNSSSLQAPMEPSMFCHTSPTEHTLSRSEEQVDVPGIQPIFHLPIYVHSQPSSMEGFRGTFYDLQSQNQASLLPQYNVLPQSHHAHMMQHFPYHHVGIGLPSGHIPQAHPWSSSASSHPQSKPSPTERRAAALVKFKQKKKDRCYDKKIRYVNRKRLADKRPRVRGQFVRQVSGVEQLNESPHMKDYDSDVEDEPLSIVELISSPDHDTDC